MAKQKSQTVVEVQFHAVSFEGTARVGVTLDEHVELAKAIELFRGRRLTGSIEFDPKDQDPDQTELFEGDKARRISGSFDAKRLTLLPSDMTSSLTFNPREIDCGCLARFATRAGRIIIDEVVDIPPKDKPSQDD